MAKKAELKGVLSLEDNLFSAGLRMAERKAVSFGRSVGSKLKGFITGPLGAASGAVGAFFTAKAFAGGIEGAIELGAGFEKLHRQTGLSVGSIATLSEQFKMADVDVSLLGTSVNKMQRSLFLGTEGSEALRSTFQLLKLPIQDVLKLKPEEQFKAIGKAISELPDPALRTASAMAIFGRSGAQLLPVFQNMDDVNFGALSEKAKTLEENAESFHKASIALKMAHQTTENFSIGVAATAAPEIAKYADAWAKFPFLTVGKKVGYIISEGIKTTVDHENPFRGLGFHLDELVRSKRLGNGFFHSIWDSVTILPNDKLSPTDSKALNGQVSDAVVDGGISDKEGRRTVASLLPFRERRDAEDARVALGGDRETSSPFANAGSAVRSGDTSRRRAEEQRQERLANGAATTNELLGQLNQNVAALVQN